jgi:putative spermidine/putrescine transport system permease protein
MLNSTVDIAAEASVAAAAPRRRARTWWKGPLLVSPAVIAAILFSLIPLGYLIIVSGTRESEFFFGSRDFSWQNYERIWDRYQRNIQTTLRLATLSSLVDLVFGYPFAYILVRKVRYRELVRTLMVFPLFGPLYLAFGLYYVLLPGGPLSPAVEFLGIEGTTLLYSEPMTLFAMAIFTFPFMVMNVGAALSNVDPMLEEAARTLGAKGWQIFVRVLFPLSWSGILAGFLMCFGWNLGVFVQPILLGGLEQQGVLSLVLYQKGMTQFDYGLAAAMGVVLMGLAFGVTWVSLRFSRGALGA